MKTLFVFAALLIFNSLGYSQWIIQNSPTTAALQDVHFENSELGWAVGGSDFFPQSSVILITTNGGNNWSAQTSPLTRQLNALSFVSSSQGWAVGSGGKIITTANGGINWSEQASGVVVDLFDVFFINNLKGWAVGDGGKILATTDGGLIWQNRNSGTTDPLWSIWFSDANTGWAVGGSTAFGNSRILKTTNGGNNWTAQAEPTGKMFSDLSFADANTGWAVSESGTVINTNNGGDNWNSQNSGTAVEWLYATYAINNQSAWVGGGGGYLASTVNGGTNWIQSNSGITQAIRGLYFIDTNTGWAVGDEGKILKYSQATIQLTSPSGGESSKSGSNQSITWSSNGITNIKIEYSTDNGTSWNLVTASTAANTGNYLWSVPNLSSTQTRVRISDAVNSAINDISDNVFIIYSSSITLLSPNGGEVWNSGTNQYLRWTSSNVSYIKIEYSLDNGLTWNLITNSTPASSENYLWQLPVNSTTQALIKIADTSNGSTNDQSDNPFTIQIPTIRLISPNGGEKWKFGTSQNITWESENLDLINIEYSINNGSQWKTIISSISASLGSFNWMIPNEESDLVIIRISDASDLNLFDTNDTKFTIEVLRKITVTYPNGGEVLQRGKTNTITWISENVERVKIEYLDYNNNWIEIASGIEAAIGRYDWQIPEDISINRKIRIASMNNPLISDENDAYFITRLLKIISPNGGEIWQWSASKKVEWYDSDKNRTGKLLEYSSDNGITWQFF